MLTSFWVRFGTEFALYSYESSINETLAQTKETRTTMGM